MEIIFHPSGTEIVNEIIIEVSVCECSCLFSDIAHSMGTERSRFGKLRSLVETKGKCDSFTIENMKRYEDRDDHKRRHDMLFEREHPLAVSMTSVVFQIEFDESHCGSAKHQPRVQLTVFELTSPRKANDENVSA